MMTVTGLVNIHHLMDISVTEAIMIIKTVHGLAKLERYKLKCSSPPISTNYTLSNTLSWMGG